MTASKRDVVMWNLYYRIVDASEMLWDGLYDEGAPELIPPDLLQEVEAIRERLAKLQEHVDKAAPGRTTVDHRQGVQVMVYEPKRCGCGWAGDGPCPIHQIPRNVGKST